MPITLNYQPDPRLIGQAAYSAGKGIARTQRQAQNEQNRFRMAHLALQRERMQQEGAFREAGMRQRQGDRQFQADRTQYIQGEIGDRAQESREFYAKQAEQSFDRRQQAEREEEARAMETEELGGFLDTFEEIPDNEVDDDTRKRREELDRDFGGVIKARTLGDISDDQLAAARKEYARRKREIEVHSKRKPPPEPPTETFDPDTKKDQWELSDGSVIDRSWSLETDPETGEQKWIVHPDMQAKIANKEKAIADDKKLEVEREKKRDDAYENRQTHIKDTVKERLDDLKAEKEAVDDLKESRDEAKAAYDEALAAAEGFTPEKDKTDSKSFAAHQRLLSARRSAKEAYDEAKGEYIEAKSEYRANRKTRAELTAEVTAGFDEANPNLWTRRRIDEFEAKPLNPNAPPVIRENRSTLADFLRKYGDINNMPEDVAKWVRTEIATQAAWE